jgi:putative hydrolases of HD superfamily
MLRNYSDCWNQIYKLGIVEEYIPTFKLPRRGWVIKGILNPESVGEHQFSAAILATKFEDTFRKKRVDILIVQNILLIHDIMEPKPWVGDITPHCNVSPEEKKQRELTAIKEILRNHPELMELWLDYEEGRTSEWRIGMEIDKLHGIDRSSLYEVEYPRFQWSLIWEFYNNAVIEKKQIQTDELLLYADKLLARSK